MGSNDDEDDDDSKNNNKSSNKDELPIFTLCNYHPHTQR